MFSDWRWIRVRILARASEEGPGGLSVRTGNDLFPPKALMYENCGQNHDVTDSAHNSNLVSYG